MSKRKQSKVSFAPKKAVFPQQQAAFGASPFIMSLPTGPKPSSMMTRSKPRPYRRVNIQAAARG